MSDPPVFVFHGKMTVPDFQIFLQRWKRGEFKNQRFGQAFINAMDLRGPWDELTRIEERLFYTTDKSEANKLILNHFLEY